MRRRVVQVRAAALGIAVIAGAMVLDLMVLADRDAGSFDTASTIAPTDAPMPTVAAIESSVAPVATEAPVTTDPPAAIVVSAPQLLDWTTPVVAAPNASTNAPAAPVAAPLPPAPTATPTAPVAPPAAAPQKSPSTTAATPSTTGTAATTSTPATTSTAAAAVEYLEYQASRSAGRIVLAYANRSITLYGFYPNAGWVYRVESDGPRTVKLKMFNTTTEHEAEWKATIEDSGIQVEN